MPTALEVMQVFRNSMGYWAEMPGHPVEYWRSEVANDDTRQGYWQWVEGRIEQEMHSEQRAKLRDSTQD